MRDPVPFRFQDQTPGAKVAIVTVGVLAAALLLVVLVILAAFAWDLIVWVWS
jgi:hypothetical protein